MTFYENLDLLIHERKINRNILAKEIDIRESTIRSWKTGTQPTLDKLIKLSQYFAIPIDDLVGNNTNRSDEYTELVKQYKLHDESIKMSVRKLLDMQQTTEEKSYNSKIG